MSGAPPGDADRGPPQRATPGADAQGQRGLRGLRGLRAAATRALRLAALGYVAVLLLSAAFADRLIFFPPPASYDASLAGLVRLPTERGDTVAALHHSVAGARLTVIFAHGNAEDLGHQEDFARWYGELGVSLLAFEYPGYGLSTGRPSERGAYAAADAAYRYVTEELGVPRAAVVAHGRSLGGAIMVDLASRREVGGLVVESSFVSAYRVMTRVRLLPIDQFESLAKLADVSSPVLVMHGEADDVIPPWHGRTLFEAVPEERRSALWVAGAGHNDLMWVAGGRYWEALGVFLGTVEDAR